MSNNKWEEVCKSEQSMAFEPKTFCRAHIPIRSSPIDRFLDATSSLIKIAGYLIPPMLVGASVGGSPVGQDPSSGRLVLLGLLSETERYIRSVLIGLVEFCPNSRAQLKDEDIKFSSIEQFGFNNISVNLFTGVSFSSKDAIISQTAKATGFKGKANSVLNKCINDYNILCHLRHASVHGGGELGINNLLVVGLDPASRSSVFIDYKAFNDSMLVCRNLVRAYNRALYKHTIERWMVEKYLTGDWSKDKYLYNRLYDLFCSRIDSTSPGRAYDAYVSLKPTILAAINSEPFKK